jgi:hypothetical protein
MISKLTDSQRNEVLERIKTAYEALAFIPLEYRSPQMELILALLKELEHETQADTSLQHQPI